MGPLAIAALLATVTPPANADAVASAPARELSVMVGSGLYAIPDHGSLSMLWGPKVTVEYGAARGEHLWIDFGIGLTGGACMADFDGGCVLVSGAAFEPFGGIKVKTGGGGRWVAYAKLVAGAVLLEPDRQSWYGRGVSLRQGGGFRYMATRNVAVGFELTGLVAFGEFYVGTPGTGEITGLDAGFGLDARF
jgi:hypothetical protein